MKLDIQNQAGKWTEIKRAVFSAQGMKIFFSSHQVSLQALMRILSETTAETSFTDEALQPGMSRALEQYSGRLLNLPAKMVMEEGY